MGTIPTYTFFIDKFLLENHGLCKIEASASERGIAKILPVAVAAEKRQSKRQRQGQKRQPGRYEPERMRGRKRERMRERKREPAPGKPDVRKNIHGGTRPTKSLT